MLEIIRLDRSAGLSCDAVEAEYMGLAILHWVVQRSAQTGALITFLSFANYADAEKHKAELEAIADPLGRTNVVAIESLPIAELPKR